MENTITALKPIEALSFWRFTRLKRCQLSGAFPYAIVASSICKPPSGRPQVLGNLYHLLMQRFHELATAGQLEGKSLRSEFNIVVDKVAQEIRGTASIRHLGDPNMWAEVSEIYRALGDLAEKKRSGTPARSCEVKTETTLHSKDKLLFGQLDAYFIHDGGIDLVDYKSGTMTEGENPKEDYADQLYFYAYLILENLGVYPRSLTLVGKDGSKVSLKPSVERSNELANEMRVVLANYNDSVSRRLEMDRFANPSDVNCLFCDAKPSCPSFWKAAKQLDLPFWSHAVVGKQFGPIERSRLGGASLVLEVIAGSLASTKIKVARIFEGRFPELKDVPGQDLLITNLKLMSESRVDLVEVTERSQILNLGVPK